MHIKFIKNPLSYLNRCFALNCLCDLWGILSKIRSDLTVLYKMNTKYINTIV